MAAVEKVEELIADAIAKGGKVVTGGKRHALGGILLRADGDLRRDQPTCGSSKEEIFGPVSRRSSSSRPRKRPSGSPTTPNSASPAISTRSDLGRAFRVMEGLKYGMVGVNEGLITTPEAPFGGVKESGLGTEGGHQGIDDYLDTKYVCIGGLGL